MNSLIYWLNCIDRLYFGFLGHTVRWFSSNPENLQTWWRGFPISTNQLGVCFFCAPNQNSVDVFSKYPQSLVKQWWFSLTLPADIFIMYLYIYIYPYQVIQFVTFWSPIIGGHVKTTTLDRSGHVFIHRAPKKGHNRRMARFSIGRNSSSKSIQSFCLGEVFVPSNLHPNSTIAWASFVEMDRTLWHYITSIGARCSKKPFMLMWRCLLSRFCWVHKFCFTKFWVLEIGGVGWLGNWHGYWHCKLELSKVV